MLPPLQYSALGFESFGAEVLHPAAMIAEAPLAASVWQPKRGESGDWNAASRAPFRPVERGFRWGPAWSTAWFRVEGSVPAAMRRLPLWLRFSSGTEATVWRRDWRVQGLDPYRDRVALTAILGRQPRPRGTGSASSSRRPATFR